MEKTDTSAISLPTKPSRLHVQLNVINKPGGLQRNINKKTALQSMNTN